MVRAIYHRVDIRLEYNRDPVSMMFRTPCEARLVAPRQCLYSASQFNYTHSVVHSRCESELYKPENSTGEDAHLPATLIPIRRPTEYKKK